MSISKRGEMNDKGRPFKSMGQHDKFLSRITKTLYYTKLPKTERLSLPVSELASDLFSEFQQGQSLNLLYCDEVASISRNACVSPCSLVLALLYLERLKKCNIDYLRCIEPSKLFLISLMISSKYLHDDGEENEVFTDEWAMSGDISVSELCKLEKEFLKAIEWNIFVYEKSFWDRFKKLEQEISLREGQKRGWFTYTELDILVTKMDVTNLINSILSFSVIIAATYMAGILTIAGSMFLSSKIPGTALYKKIETENKTVTLPIETERFQDILEENLTIPETLGSDEMELFKYNEIHKTITSTVTVLNTSLFLVSLLCNDKNLEEKRPESDSTWDWWNNSLLNWLNDISKYEETEIVPPKYENSFVAQSISLDMAFINKKLLELEDKIHRATKLRLQEQLERSWHEEWTDSIFATIGNLYEISVY